MKRLILSLIFFVPFISSAQNTLSIESGKPSPPANLQDISWIAGHWEGEFMGSKTEEIWTEPFGGSMMGSFKMADEEEVKFYELMTISENNGSLILKIKHFNGDLSGWEEKDESVEFPLVKVDPKNAYFAGLTFRKISNDQLNIYVLSEFDDGSEEEIMFVYRRVQK